MSVGSTELKIERRCRLCRRREPGESFPAFTRRASDEELGELAGLEPARVRQREEEEAAA